MRLEKPQNRVFLCPPPLQWCGFFLTKEKLFTNYLGTEFTQNLIDKSSNVWKWINVVM